MKIHEMRLHDDPYQKIKSGLKTIEMRLYDDKRKIIEVGDIIEFENRVTLEKIRTKVVNLFLYNSFSELYEKHDKVSLGYNKEDEANPSDMEQYYSKEEQNMYGVVGINITLI